MTDEKKEKLTEKEEKIRDDGWDSGYDAGYEEGRSPGKDVTEIGDITDLLYQFADNILDEEDPKLYGIRSITYKEVNDIKRDLIEAIDTMIEN